MITVEIVAVHRTTAGPTGLGIYDDKFIPGLKRLADVIHEGGAKLVSNWHASRQTNSTVTGMPIIGPSAIPAPYVRKSWK